jgi:nitric oxide dioxygenase
MTPEQMYVVKLSFNRVLNQQKQAGELFYGRLFAIAPEVRAMFNGDMKHLKAGGEPERISA